MSFSWERRRAEEEEMMVRLCVSDPSAPLAQHDSVHIDIRSAHVSDGCGPSALV